MIILNLFKILVNTLILAPVKIVVFILFICTIGLLLLFSDYGDLADDIMADIMNFKL